MKLKAITVCCVLFLSACTEDKQTGEACLGLNNDSLVENMQNECKKGDAVATKHPAYFCDFNYAVAYNNYNSALCIYTGAMKKERMSSVPAPSAN